VTRPRLDGSPAPTLLALELPISRGRSHAALRGRLEAAFSPAGLVEPLTVRRGPGAAATLLRVVLEGGTGAAGRRGAPSPHGAITQETQRTSTVVPTTADEASVLRSRAEELGRIAARALPLAGTRLWVHGWCFDRHGPLRPAAAVLLVDAWGRYAHARAVSPSG
jgi:hypothetical protein